MPLLLLMLNSCIMEPLILGLGALRMGRMLGALYFGMHEAGARPMSKIQPGTKST